MKIQDIKSQLKNKLRSERDLFRYIQNRTDENPNYTLLLGAGTSITSGVRSGTQLCTEWRKDLYEELSGLSANEKSKDEITSWLKTNHGDWYNPINEYSSLFEKKYDLQRQRRQFVETEIKDSFPCIGYCALTNLVDQSYLNTIFTTNFDDLVNEAFFYHSSNRPIVCAHDSSIHSVTITSKRAKIIKLHGDYLFDDIKSTNRETESLDSNMRDKFIEFAKDFGLIIIGYSGCDRSIMETLSSLLKNENYFRNGIYWCIRKDSEIPEELRRMLWKERVFFVEIDGFDEFMVNLHNFLNPNSSIINSSIHFNQKLSSKLLEKIKFLNSSNPIITKAQERLEKNTKRNELANLVFREERDKDKKSETSFNDDEVITIKKIENYSLDEDFKNLEINALQELDKDHRAEVKEVITNILCEYYKNNNKSSEAKKHYERMQILQPYSPHWILKISEIESHINTKIKYIDQAIELNLDYHYSYQKKAAALEHLFKTSDSKSRESIKKEIIINYEKSIELDPDKNNASWTLLHSFISNEFDNTEEKNKKLDEIEDQLLKQGTYWRYLNLKIDRVHKKTNQDDVIKLIEQIESRQSKANPKFKIDYLSLKLETFIKNRSKDNAEHVFKELLSDEKFYADSDICSTMFRYLRKFTRNFDDANLILDRNLESEGFNKKIYRLLLDSYHEMEKTEKIQNLIEKYNKNIIKENTLIYESNIVLHLSRGENKEAISNLIKLLEVDPLHEKYNLSYIYLKDNNYSSALEISKKVLEKVNYSILDYPEIINYELARKRLGKNINKERLESIVSFHELNMVKCVVSALKDEIDKVINYAKEAIEDDQSFIFDLKDWPVFDEHRDKQKFKELFN